MNHGDQERLGLLAAAAREEAEEEDGGGGGGGATPPTNAGAGGAAAAAGGGDAPPVCFGVRDGASTHKVEMPADSTIGDLKAAVSLHAPAHTNYIEFVVWYTH